MGIDIRTPMGLMFAILGAIVTARGVLSDPTLYRRSLGINVNLWWGLALLVFGLAFLWLGRRGVGRTPRD